MAEKNGDIEKEMERDNEGYLIPAFMLAEGEIHWYTKINGEIVYLSADREIIIDPVKIQKYLAWQDETERRLKSMRNKTVDQLCEIKHVGLSYQTIHR